MPTVKEYYKGFQATFGGFAVLIGALPVLSALLPNDIAPYAFPPLDGVFRLFTVGLIVMVSFAVFYLQDLGFVQDRTKRAYAMWLLVGVALCASIAYLGALHFFVRTVTPADSDAITVTVGFTRSQFAIDAFGDASDWELLRQRGPNEEEISRLWTAPSIFIAKTLVFGTYLTAILSAITMVSLGVLFNTMRPKST